ncbi:hypothetical protein ITE22_14835, partial [Acinetobacter baumannii]|nr:hypothetical protein [Acinetobacter baumannii]
MSQIVYREDNFIGELLMEKFVFKKIGEYKSDWALAYVDPNNLGAVVDKVKYPSNPTVFRAVVLDS